MFSSFHSQLLHLQFMNVLIFTSIRNTQQYVDMAEIDRCVGESSRESLIDRAMMSAD